MPGYIALYLTRPLDVAMTLAAALLTFFLVRIASTFVIVYGRRRTALMILVGYGVGVLLNAALASALESVGDPGLATGALATGRPLPSLARGQWVQEQMGIAAEDGALGQQHPAVAARQRGPRGRRRFGASHLHGDVH